MHMLEHQYECIFTVYKRVVQYMSVCCNTVYDCISLCVDFAATG